MWRRVRLNLSLFVLNAMLHECTLVSCKLIMGFLNVHIS